MREKCCLTYSFILTSLITFCYDINANRSLYDDTVFISPL